MGEHEESDVVPPDVGEQVADIRTRGHGAEGYPRLFEYLASGARFYGFAIFEMTARQRPGPGAVRTDSPPYEDFSVSEDDRAYPHARCF